MPELRRWIDLLDDEDLNFLKRFVIASGSLKDVAAAYGISYPTVRIRLDRLIAKIRVYDEQRPMDEFERTVRSLHIDGKLDQQTMKTLLALHSSQKEPDHAPEAFPRSDGPGHRKSAARE